MENKTTALATVAPTAVSTVYDRMDNPMEAIEQMAIWFADSQMFGVTNKAQGAVLAMACMHEQRNPIEIAREYHIIKGRLSMRADAMQAKFQEAGGRVRWVESTDDRCEAVFTHETHAPDGFTVAITMAEMKSRDLTTAMYKKFPRQMLRARVISEGVRAILPGIVVGVYTPEEITEDRRPATTYAAAEPEPARTVEADPEPEVAEPEEPGEPPAPAKLDEKRVANILAWFERHKAAQADLEAFLGCPAGDWDEDHAVTLDAVRQEAMKAKPGVRDDELAKLLGVADREPGEEG